MYFELVTGGAGSGKSGYIEQMIEKCAAAGKKALVIVPERFSHVEERTLCARFGGLGINGIEASTFSKLAKRLEERGEYLRASGRQMLILKAAAQNAAAGEGIFESAVERTGFIDRVGEAISEFKRCMISPETLCGYIGGGLLGKKLNALGAIYEGYNELLGEKFADPDEDMELLAARINSDGGFSDTQVFIDGFTDFLPVHYSVIAALLRWADGVFVSLTINDSGLRSPEGIFAPACACKERLLTLAKDCGAQIGERRFSGEGAHIKSPDLKYFIQNYDEYQPGTQCPACENITITRLSDRHAEVERLAGRILYEVRERGLRFRDIGVIVGNLDTYAHIIDAVFADCGIPYFADRKMSVAEHPVIRLALAAMRIINENWSFGSVFEYLRSGFVYRRSGNGVQTIDAREIDALEDYAVKYGIRGRKAWLGEEAWKPKKAGIFDEITNENAREEDVGAIDELRRELMAPFAVLMEKIRGRRRVRELAEGLFDFLNDINLYEGLLKEQKQLEERNRLDDAARLGEIWNALMETLDQCVTTSGEEFVSRERFSMMIETGLSKCSVDAVPSGADRVAVGTAEDTRPVQVRTLFIIGAVRGELPCETEESGILNDADRAVLEQEGIELLPGADRRTALAEFKLYSALTAACERLIISFPDAGENGEKTIPCALADELLRTFSDLKITVPDEKEEWENLFVSKKRTYYKMLSRMVSDISREECEFWQELAPRLDTNEEQRAVFNKKASPNADFSIFEHCGGYEDILSRAARYKRDREHISAEAALALYSGRPFSITALQMYNKCPFSYFIQYGLGVYAQEEYKLRSYDLGQLVHWAVCEFCKKVQEGALTLEEVQARWTGLTKQDAGKIISELGEHIERTAKAANPDYGDERLSLMCRRAVKTLSEAADTIRTSLVSGGFASCNFEKDFLFTIENDGESVDIKGVIDRIDIAPPKDGKNALLRVIDYKTGAQSFKISGICNKTDLQLIIYALAAQKLYENGELGETGECGARVAAVLYNKIKDETVKGAIDEKPDTHGTLDGVIVTEDEPENADDAELAVHDRALCEGGAKSGYLPLKTKKNGGLAKSGAALSEKRFAALEKYVSKTACETKTAVYCGEIAACPAASGQNTPCAYCDFAQICLHDDERDGTRKLITSDEAAWEIIGGGEDNRNE